VDGYDVTVRTKYINIPGSAFEGIQYNMTYDSGGDWVVVYDYYPHEASHNVLMAPVNLPHGAQVNELTFYWKDTDPRPYDPDSRVSGQGSIELRRTDLSDQSDDVMASALTQGSSGYGSSYDDSIEFATIDNSNYVYYLVLKLPFFYSPDGGSTWYSVAYNAVVLEYTEVDLE
jgi:hypothetical protein